MAGAGAGFSGMEIFFLVSAAVGGGVFVLRLVLQLIVGVDDADTDLTAGHGDVAHADADLSFKLLSLQGLTAFFMMFGLVGFAMLRGSGVSEGPALVAAVAAGLAAVWVIGKIFASVRRLQSSGTIDTARAVGGGGTVYLSIPAGGTGKVQVVVQGRLREFDAVSASGEGIPTGGPVRVVEVRGSVLVVERAGAAGGQG